MQNVILLAVIASAFFLALRHIYRDRESGGCSGCSGGCSGCPSAGGCLSAQIDESGDSGN